MDDKLIDRIVEEVARRLTAGPFPTSSVGSELVTADIRAGRIPVNISARHIHLSDQDVSSLFGNNAQLTPYRSLYQQGEFASEQHLLVAAPSGRTLGMVRVLGPTRQASQVELSLTDCYTLGLKPIPPIRPSGDHTDSVGITLVGPAGTVRLTSGVIRANRHIHLHTSQAAAMGLANGDYVDVRIDGERPAILLGVQLRANEAFRAEMHIDTDDGNAVGIGRGAVAQILLK